MRDAPLARLPQPVHVHGLNLPSLANRRGTRGHEPRENSRTLVWQRSCSSIVRDALVRERHALHLLLQAHHLTPLAWPPPGHLKACTAGTGNDAAEDDDPVGLLRLLQVVRLQVVDPEGRLLQAQGL